MTTLICLQFPRREVEALLEAVTDARDYELIAIKESMRFSSQAVEQSQLYIARLDGLIAKLDHALRDPHNVILEDSTDGE